MNKLTRHILLPALAPLTFLLLAVTPISVLGCRNRGLLALIIALVSVIGALYCAIQGTGGRRRHDPEAGRWLISSLILAIPPIALLFLA